MKSIEDLKPLKDKRIFITGGTGFIGRPFVEALLNLNNHFKLGMHLTVLTRSPDETEIKWPHWKNNPALTLLQGDMRGFHYADGADVVIHGATESRLHNTNDAGMESTILEGTERLIEKFKDAGRVVFLSSGAVYGSRSLRADPISEAEPSSGHISLYGASKLKAEEMILRAYEPTKVARIARLFAFVGPGLPLEGPFAIGQFFAQALAKQKITVRGTGLSKRSFMDLEDLIEVLLSLMVNEDFPYATCNVGSSEVVTIRELAERIDKLTHNQGIEVLGGRFEDGSYIPDVTRMESLNAGPQISLDESLRRVWASLNQANW